MTAKGGLQNRRVGCAARGMGFATEDTEAIRPQQPVEKGVTPDPGSSPGQALIRGPRSTRGVYSARKAWIPAGVETRRRRAGMTTRAGFCARTFFNGQPSRLCGLCDSLWLVLPLRAVHPVRGRAACVGWVAWPRFAWPWDDERPPASPGHAHASVGMPPGAGGSRRPWACHPARVGRGVRGHATQLCEGATPPAPSFRATRCEAERSTADRGTHSSASRSDTAFVVAS